MTKVVLGADRGGLDLKDDLKRRLAANFAISDVGAHAMDETDDCPDFARAVAQAVVSGQAERGSSGVGAAIAANKVRGVRACLCHDTYSAQQGVEPDNMNILCLGARVVGIELACELTSAFLRAEFSGGERHVRRLQKVLAMERDGR